MNDQTVQRAESLDEKDPLSSFSLEFEIPKDAKGNNLIYLCGNSLGLQPKQTKEYISQELEHWAKWGVDGHTKGKNAWLPYHELLTHQMAQVVGAKDHEVVVMNTLTVNLHLMMVSFYQPTKSRHKIIIEADAFPSDRYAVESQIRFHGYDPEHSLLLWEPNPETGLCEQSELEALLNQHKDSVALIMLGNSNYYSGQVYPIKEITQLGHSYGAKVGFNLAHGAGNIICDLHDNGVDFAVWCTYKYLNSGPGSLGGVFVHERHSESYDLPRFTGWWGHNKETRFKMRDGFDPIAGAEGWQLSNPPILSMAAIRASLDIFDRAGIHKIREKSIQLTAYLAELLSTLNSDKIRIMTPLEPEHRGAQLSLQLKDSDRSLHDALTHLGVVSDWREPDVIRVAPAPLYNSYRDIYDFVQRLNQCL
ncbi:kynureninase [Flavobacteriaceae bacterium]|jgi:kynureninase|nr:kynureninase [Flavobacteriaceae bacterium]